jgi:hypothetical protein
MNNNVTYAVIAKIEKQRDSVGQWIPVYQLELSGFDKPVQVSKALWDKTRVGYSVHLECHSI